MKIYFDVMQSNVKVGHVLWSNSQGVEEPSPENSVIYFPETPTASIILLNIFPILGHVVTELSFM